MHAASLNSPRLKRLLKVLRQKGYRWHTSLELTMKARTVCAHTGISELRAHGYGIKCRRRGNIFEYRMDPIP